MQAKTRRMLNQRYNDLTVIKILGIENKKRKVLCYCHVCKSIKIMNAQAVKSYQVKTCGCKQGNRKRKLNKIKINGEIASIYLQDDKIAAIDKADVDKINKYTWYYTKANGVCAVNFGNIVYLHHIILGVKNSEIIDHIDNDKCNNCKYNLRVVTQKQNAMNTSSHKDSVSKFKGVSMDRNKWKAQIQDKYIGNYDTEIEAAYAYDEMAVILFGEYANLNFK